MKQWYAIYTRSRCEKKIASLLTKKEIENYCPLNRVVRKWADRKKMVHEPLFPSYVFVHASDKEIYSIKELSANIVNPVYWLGKPAIIKDAEIMGIRSFLNEHTNVSIERTKVNVGDRVRVISGALAHYEGNITGVQNSTIKMILPSLGYAMTAELKMSNVEIITDYRLKTELS